MQQRNDYDIAIVGAGLVGTALACCLQPLGMRVLLLDQKPLLSSSCNARDFTAERMLASRPLSLAYASYRLLQQLDLWDAPLASGQPDSAHWAGDLSLAQLASPIARVHVSTRHALGRVEFSAAQLGYPALGYVVPALALHYALAARAQQAVDFVSIQQLHSVSQNTEQLILKYQDAAGQLQSCSAALCVGADGAQSQLRSLADFSVAPAGGTKQAHAAAATSDAVAQASPALEPAAQHAITANWQGDLQGTAYERFVSGGVLAWLPQSDQRVGMVWVMSQAQANAAMQWDAAQWQQQARAAMRGYMPAQLKFKQVTASYALRTQYVAQPQQGRIYLMGNAAHTLYPLAAQGFNLSLRDVALWVEQLAAVYQARIKSERMGQQSSAVSAQLDAASAASQVADAPTSSATLSPHNKLAQFNASDAQHLLQHYRQGRARDLKRTLQLTQLLARQSRVLSEHSPQLLQHAYGLVHGVALLGLHSCSPIKRQLALQLMGLSAPVPRLMRGLSCSL